MSGSIFLKVDFFFADPFFNYFARSDLLLPAAEKRHLA